MAASEPSATSAAQPATVASRAVSRSGDTAMRPAPAYQATALSTSPARRWCQGGRARRDRPGARSRPARAPRRRSAAPGPRSRRRGRRRRAGGGRPPSPPWPPATRAASRKATRAASSVMAASSSTATWRGDRRRLLWCDAPVERGQGAALVDARLPAQRAGRLARGRRAHHLVAGGLEGVARRGQGGGLARAGHADHQLHAPARGAGSPPPQRAGRR